MREICYFAKKGFKMFIEYDSISPQRHGSDQTKMKYELLSLCILMQDIGIFMTWSMPKGGFKKEMLACRADSHGGGNGARWKILSEANERGMQERIPSTEACGVIENLGSVMYSSA